MKKINFLFMVMLALTAGIFSSCTDEETDPPTIVITEQGSPTYAPGTSVTYHLVIAANEDLVDFWATESVVGLPLSMVENIEPADAFDDIDFYEFKNNLTKVEFDFTYNIPTTVGADTEISIEFEVNDKKAMTTETMTFTVVANAGDVDRFTAILMGGQSNLTTGSYLDASTGNVMMQSAADAAQETVDMVYYYGSANMATICAPVDATVNGGANNLSLCEAWTTKNPTKFGASTVTGAQFDAITDDSLLSGISGLTETKMTSLSVGDVFAFETVNDKMGLVKVVALTDGADQTIEIEVVIQK